MSSTLSTNGVVLATAMAVSGTVILLMLRLQKNFPSPSPSTTTNNHLSINPIPQSTPRSCISSDGKRRERKKKRVHFAEDVVDPSGNSEEFRKLRFSNYDKRKSSSSFKTGGGRKVREQPANRMALYNGILKDRVHQRVAYSY